MQMLTDVKVKQFIEDGFVKIENAFPGEVAAAAREILWKDIGCSPHDSTTWTRPVIRLGDYTQEPFRLAVNTPVLHSAFDELTGKGRWFPRGSLGTFPVRFPSDEDPGDAGWHADASFYGADGSMRLNYMSRGRLLLMLFLFSDIDIEDAPTRILVGSHLDIPSLLKPAGDEGLSFIELAQKLTTTLDRKIAHATGPAGTVYLCHPFLIHGAQAHRGRQPRFLAQPPLQPRSEDSIQVARESEDYSPVELAIRSGLGL
jgi:hypothetical protein